MANTRSSVLLLDSASRFRCMPSAESRSLILAFSAGRCLTSRSLYHAHEQG